MRGPRYAGIDWAAKKNAHCVVDGNGEIVEEGFTTHSEEGLGALLASLERHRVLRVAIERPEGLLVDRLVGAGLTVIPVDPRALAASRPRYTQSGQKSDPLDAFCLAELARTDAHRFAVLVPDSDETRSLRALTRTRENLLRRRADTTHQLRDQLEAFWPGAATMFAVLNAPVALDFLHAFPSPLDARELGEERLARLLQKDGHRIRTSPSELLARMHSGPDAVTGTAEAKGRRQIVLGLVSLLKTAAAEIETVTSAIVQQTHAHPDGEIFFSPFLRKDIVTPALLIAGFGDDRNRIPSAAVIAARAGVSPVAHQSGPQQVAFYRYACDRRLRRGVMNLADGSRRRNPWASALYAASRERGHSHSHALRVVGRGWLRVLWRCWQDRVPYDPAKHDGLRRIEAAKNGSLRATGS